MNYDIWHSHFDSCCQPIRCQLYKEGWPHYLLLLLHILINYYSPASWCYPPTCNIVCLLLTFLGFSHSVWFSQVLSLLMWVIKNISLVYCFLLLLSALFSSQSFQHLQHALLCRHCLLIRIIKNISILTPKKRQFFSCGVAWCSSDKQLPWCVFIVPVEYWPKVLFPCNWWFPRYWCGYSENIQPLLLAKYDSQHHEVFEVMSRVPAIQSWHWYPPTTVGEMAILLSPFY